MLNQDQRLPGCVNAGAVQRVAGYDVDICGKVLLECCYFGCFAGGLAADYGAHLGRRSISCNNSIDILSLNAVDDVVAGSRD